MQVEFTLEELQAKAKHLEDMLKDMESDFTKCARGISHCFFCENDEACTATSDNGCCFVWKPHLD